MVLFFIWLFFLLVFTANLCCDLILPSLSSLKISYDIALLFLSSPVLLDVLVVGVIRVLPPFRFDCVHQHGHNNEGKHADHHGEIPDHVPEVLLSQSLVQRVACSSHVAPPVIQEVIQCVGKGRLKMKGQVWPISVTQLVERTTRLLSKNEKTWKIYFIAPFVCFKSCKSKICLTQTQKIKQNIKKKKKKKQQRRCSWVFFNSIFIQSWTFNSFDLRQQYFTVFYQHKM